MAAPAQRVEFESGPSGAARAADGWQASLQLGYSLKRDRTILSSSSHYGPLRVQRPFYPEGAPCHTYLLHPPGGMVAGDNLLIGVNCEADTDALITTPAAGKLYRVANHASPQYQGVSATLASGASLEWLPQETILFNGARGELLSRFDLAVDSQLLGWDIVCLGRRASGERFEQGSVKQRIEIYRQGLPLFLDRVDFTGGSPMLDAHWGMAGKPVVGTLFATVNDSQKVDLDALREVLPKVVPEIPTWGVTLRAGVLLVRYLGGSAEGCRRGFEKVWYYLRPLLSGREAHRPRIWNT